MYSKWGTIIEPSPAFFSLGHGRRSSCGGDFNARPGCEEARSSGIFAWCCDAKLHRPVRYQHVRTHAHSGHEHVRTLVAHVMPHSHSVGISPAGLCQAAPGSVRRPFWEWDGRLVRRPMQCLRWGEWALSPTDADTAPHMKAQRKQRSVCRSKRSVSSVGLPNLKLMQLGPSWALACEAIQSCWRMRRACPLPQHTPRVTQCDECSCWLVKVGGRQRVLS